MRFETRDTRVGRGVGELGYGVMGERIRFARTKQKKRGENKYAKDNYYGAWTG